MSRKKESDVRICLLFFPFFLPLLVFGSVRSYINACRWLLLLVVVVEAEKMPRVHKNHFGRGHMVRWCVCRIDSTGLGADWLKHLAYCTGRSGLIK